MFEHLLSNTKLLPEINVTYACGMFAILAVTAVLASWLGLFVSAVAPTQKSALTVVPLIIIPQLIFGGLIRPIKDIAQTESFALTQHVLTQLQGTLPDEMLAQLNSLQDHQFTHRKHFLSAVKTMIGAEAALKFQDTLLRYAKTLSFWRKPGMLPFHLYDVMLQKWSFEVTLLYNSLGAPNVLKKVLDFDRYQEYEYIRFEPIHLIDLFFEIDPSRRNEGLFTQILGGMIACHFVLLVLPTYFWLRKTLLT